MTSTETSVMGIATEIYAKYSKTTTKKMKLIDAFLAYVLTTGIIQFLYCVLVGTFPFNSFLSGFICTVGVFVLTGTLGRHPNLHSIHSLSSSITAHANQCREQRL